MNLEYINFSQVEDMTVSHCKTAAINPAAQNESLILGNSPQDLVTWRHGWTEDYVVRRGDVHVPVFTDTRTECLLPHHIHGNSRIW